MIHTSHILCLVTWSSSLWNFLNIINSKYIALSYTVTSFRLPNILRTHDLLTESKGLPLLWTICCDCTSRGRWLQKDTWFNHIWNSQLFFLFVIYTDFKAVYDEFISYYNLLVYKRNKILNRCVGVQNTNAHLVLYYHAFCLSNKCHWKKLHRYIVIIIISVY